MRANDLVGSRGGSAWAEGSVASSRADREALRASVSRIDWAQLLKRVYDIDALACPCGGRLRFIALILDADAAKAVLESLDLPGQPPPIARARAPDDWSASPSER